LPSGCFLCSSKSDRMKKHKNSKAKGKRRLSLVTLSGLGFSGWAAVILSLAILTFFGSMLLSPRKAYRSEGPLTTVTLQILNGCGQRGAAEALANALLPGDGSLMYDVIEKADAKLMAFDKTVVVDRRGGSIKEPGLSEEAKKIGKRLGISEDDIVVLKFEDNILDIDVTVIAGSDYAGYVEKLNKAKEESL
jgi:hypothetical protein